MDKLISIAQIRKRLREHGKIVPSAEAVRYIITKYGYKPMANRNGYYKSAAATCLDMHIGEAIKYDQSKAEAIAKTNVMKPEKKEGSTYGRDYVRDGANNMQAYSQHLINKDNFGDEDMDESVKNKTIIITEEQYKKLFEGVNFKKNGPKVDMTIDQSEWDDDNQNVADTRFFGTKEDILNGKFRKGRGFVLGNRIQNRSASINLLNYVIDITSQGKLPDVNTILQYKDQFTDGLALKTLNNIVEWVNSGQSPEAINDRCKLILARQKEEYDVRRGLYDRAMNAKDGERVARYNVGIVPNTNVKLIALFNTKSFNFSDAIKNGYLRQNDINNAIIGKTDKTKGGKIGLTYDNGKIKNPNIANNFSLDNNGNRIENAENYSTVSQFIDKSIMGAAYALNKENFLPDYIVCAPSSSDFNKFYCMRLSKKLNVPFINDFFQRNVININVSQEDVQTMKNDGWNDEMIDLMKKTVRGMVMGEISYEVGGIFRRFVDANKEAFTGISVEKSSREKIPFAEVANALLKYSTMIIKSDKIDPNYKNAFSVISKELSYTKANQWLLSELPKRMKIYGITREYYATLNEFKQFLLSSADKLINGVRVGDVSPSYTRKKIVDLPKNQRKYLRNFYVVCDKYIDNDNLKNNYANSKFLIFDEDMNSGGTLMLLIDAMNDKNVQNENIMCLVNGYSAEGR
jgi:hypothetical protein